MDNNLQLFLSPNSIAVIGASKDKSKIGNIILSNLINSKFEGKLYPINPHAKRIEGLDVYQSVLDVQGRIDLAVFAIPAMYVPSMLEECGQKGIKNAVIITAGFGEVGEEGVDLELKLKEIAGKFHVNVLGPNCLGFINTNHNVDATFTATTASKGKIAFASQSGAMGTSFLDWARTNGIGLSYFVSLGNKISVNENDLLESFAEDENVDAIMMYLEDFIDGKKFFRLASQITPKKPIVILKPGNSKEAQKAMASHTGSIAQDKDIVKAALQQSGCLLVETVEETLQHHPYTCLATCFERE